jgi:uncharacterized membrane protein
MAQDVVLGTAAALSAPLFMVLGFIVWDKHWKGIVLPSSSPPHSTGTASHSTETAPHGATQH